jgi:HicA toxin of bacterial toxin-antitoxin,
MNRTHRKTLEAIFATPVPRALPWCRIEALFIAIGCEVIEGSGSHVGFKRGSLRADFHRPHPGKEVKPYEVRAAREFLESLGVKP